MTNEDHRVDPATANEDHRVDPATANEDHRVDPATANEDHHTPNQHPPTLGGSSRSELQETMETNQDHLSDHSYVFAPNPFAHATRQQQQQHHSDPLESDEEFAKYLATVDSFPPPSLPLPNSLDHDKNPPSPFSDIEFDPYEMELFLNTIGYPQDQVPPSLPTNLDDKNPNPIAQYPLPPASEEHQRLFLPRYYGFYPRDHELLLEFLKPYVHRNQDLPTSPIHHIQDVYEFSPAILTARYERGNNINQWFFTAHCKYPKYNSAQDRPVVDGGGIWIKEGTVVTIYYRGEVIGYKRFQFFHGGGDWRMEEFSFGTNSSVVLAKLYPVGEIEDPEENGKKRTLEHSDIQNQLPKRQHTTGSTQQHEGQ